MYNATVYTLNENGKRESAFVAEVIKIDGKIQMLRGNALQCTGFEGKVGVLKAGVLSEKYGNKEVALYHVYYCERHPQDVLEIVQDDCAGYRNFFSGFGK